MTTDSTCANERTAAAATHDRLVYLLLAFGTLAAFAYRTTAFGQVSWDGMALANACSLVATTGHDARRLLSRGWPAATLVTLVVADLLSLLLR